MVTAPPRTILEVFESLPEGTLCQLINDHLIISPSPSYEHQDTVTEIARQLSNHVKKKALGNVAVAPLDVYFGDQNVYQPDIIFIAKDRLHIIQEGKIKGAPDLIVEVLSPGTESYDQKGKKAVYETWGVLEYWIVAPDTKEVNGYTLSGNKYNSLSSSTGVIQSRLLSLTIIF